MLQQQPQVLSKLLLMAYSANDSNVPCNDVVSKLGYSGMQSFGMKVV